MPLSSFRFRVTYSRAGAGKCPCGQTFWCGTERELDMKLRIHRRFCSNPPVTFDKIGIPVATLISLEQAFNHAS